KNGTQIDWPALMRFKKSFTDPVPDHQLKRFSKAGIESFQQRARFVDQTSLQVGNDIFTARHFVIAAGAMPAMLNIPGEEHLITSTQFLELEALPQRIIFVGGGYIAFEFAHVSARAGAQAQILHRGARPLERFDADLVDQLVNATREIGVDVHVKTAVEEVEKRSKGYVVHASTGNGRASFEADLVVHAAGRVPEIEDLDLDKAAVKWERRGVVVNEYLQSVSSPAVYAAGDAAASGGVALTPVASVEGQVVGSNLLKGNHLKPDYSGTSSVLFTVPPLASVGLLEDTARKRGLKFKTNYKNTSAWYSSRRVAVKYSGFKTLIEEGTDRILGAHLLGPHAEEVINLFAMAIRFELRPVDIKKMIWAYPTSSSDISYML
ncbi:MAG: dihydrolipoyl dehydrogenase family protein, partial [Bacteroidota bacterium]